METFFTLRWWWSAILCSYRTYEEWKHWFVWTICQQSRVLTVPMRNGNWTVSTSLRKILGSYRTYEEWKHTNVMRKLGIASLGSYRTYEEWKLFSHYGGGEAPFCVLTVPMRNGNDPEGRRYPYKKYGSYRTYEEWKLQQCFYRTRKVFTFLPYLWGMETKEVRTRYSRSILGSYRTYEEWKRFFNLPSSQSLLVLTVPMRNGNFLL